MWMTYFGFLKKELCDEVHEILRKYNYIDVKSASTPTDLEKPLVQDGDAAKVDEHLYRSMIGSLMYLTASKPDIMFAVCACARKSTTGGCQFLGNRLISWQCKKQTVVATSTTEVEYVATASCCGQVLLKLLMMIWREVQLTAYHCWSTQCQSLKASLRRHLKLDDHDGITSIPNSEIFEQLALMGYHTDSDKLTFQKGAFSPQWRFLIHTILHCLSPKKTAWEQFSSNIATAVICLVTNRRFNFSSAAVTKLILRVKKLEAQVKAEKARKGARVVISEDDEDVEDDSSKQGRKLSDAEVQEKASNEV
ncbi:hypothetical protein Tco_0456089 [Tanacetum coccineum]